MRCLLHYHRHLDVVCLYLYSQESMHSRYLYANWFQRRVELWGEGFSMYDLLRLQKPLVRFHTGKETNVVTRYRFNMPANDPYYAYRFTQKERDNNKGIVDNTTGKEPVSGQNGDLRDGVTD